MTEQHLPADRNPRAESQTDRPDVINAAVIFRGRREVLVELAGVRYRLRITRRNKLVLQK